MVTFFYYVRTYNREILILTIYRIYLNTSNERSCTSKDRGLDFGLSPHPHPYYANSINTGSFNFSSSLKPVHSLKLKLLFYFLTEGVFILHMQWFPMKCKLQRQLQISVMTLESKLKVTYTYNISTAFNASFSFII